MATRAYQSSNGVPDVDAEHVAFLSSPHTVSTSSRSPKLGAEVIGLDLRKTTASSELLAPLQEVMAARGYLVFRGQGVMSGR